MLKYEILAFFFWPDLEKRTFSWIVKLCKRLLKMLNNAPMKLFSKRETVREKYYCFVRGSERKGPDLQEDKEKKKKRKTITE